MSGRCIRERIRGCRIREELGATPKGQESSREVLRQKRRCGAVGNQDGRQRKELSERK